MMTVNGQLEIVGASSGGTAETCTGGFDLYTAVAAEIEFVDKYVPASGSGSGGGSSGGGSSGGGSGSSGNGDVGSGASGGNAEAGDSGSSDLGGGCSASGVPAGNGALLSLALVFGARRRRARTHR